ncbi:TPA: hypothetical protein ACH5K9_000621 [Campylobacter jejuni]
MKTLLFMSTHVINECVIREFHKMQKSGYDCILVVNNESNIIKQQGNYILEDTFFDIRVKLLVLDKTIIAKLNLPMYEYFNKNNQSLGKCLWYNSDYFHYVVSYFFPHYDFYWNFSYDVYLNNDNYYKYLKLYENNNEDLLISKYRKVELRSKWCWTNDIEWIYNQNDSLFGSLWTVARMSRQLICFLVTKRIEHGVIFSKTNSKQKWLLCEIFAPTECIRGGFTAGVLINDKMGPGEIDLNNTRLFDDFDNCLYHPIKGNFLERLRKVNENIKTLQKQKICLVSEKLNFQNAITQLNQVQSKLSFQTKYGTAKTRIQNQLSYKLGQAMIANSKSILGYIRMPFVLSYIKDKHKQEQKIYQEKIKKDPSLKLPPLESYPDYQEALKLKNHLSYKLGQALIKANKTWYKGGYVKLLFEIRKLKREFRNKI